MGDIPNSIQLNNKIYGTCITLNYFEILVKASKVVIEFCKQFKLSWEIGKLIYNTVIAPAILYGIKVLILTKKEQTAIGKI